MDVRGDAAPPAGRRLRRYRPTRGVINVLFRDYNSEQRVRYRYLSPYIDCLSVATSAMAVTCMPIACNAFYCALLDRNKSMIQIVLKYSNTHVMPNFV